MPLIMVGQNIQGKHAELRAENDLEINTKAEKEIEILLDHFEYQNEILQAILSQQQGKTPQESLPRVGIGVMIFKEGRILLARRKGSHGSGDYAFPGGHLEYGESFEDCARRETREECGCEIENIRFLLVANVKSFMPKHYVHLTLVADWKSGEPVVNEPDKSEAWGWYDPDSAPQPLFETCRLSIESYRSGAAYYDAR
jgi:8-oxo-dGTP diphosphatase